MSRPTLYLCAGLQSSGSTLVSWCFLQRPDMDGVLDARNDLLPDLPAVTTPGLFCKITISSFRFSEMADHYRDDGWDVVPVLVVRDVRAIFDSLMGKSYGSNGTTAEEPPLRMRLRRFLEDLAWTRSVDGAVVRYESLLENPEATLRDACDALELPWSDDMLEWPKPKQALADPGHGSPTFRKSRGEHFSDTVDRSLADVKVDRIPADDLAWLEATFAGFNREFAYPAHVTATSPAPGPRRAVPSFGNTRRHRKAQQPLAKLQARLATLRQSLRLAKKH
jgi:hypothetical protein